MQYINYSFLGSSRTGDKTWLVAGWGINPRELALEWKSHGKTDGAALNTEQTKHHWMRLVYTHIPIQNADTPEEGVLLLIQPMMEIVCCF